MYKHAKNKSWLKRINKKTQPTERRRKLMTGPPMQSTNVGAVILRKKRHGNK